jgi:hypothetical protein
MDQHLPPAVRAVLDRYEASEEPFHEHELGANVQSVAGPADALTPAARRAVWLESSAFYFMPSAKPEGGVWGTYFGPSMTGTTKDGTEVHSPDIRQADEETIAYWASRADEAQHPILRARYADLVWDFTGLVTKRRPDVSFARTAIDAYVEAIEKKIYFHDSQAEDFAIRSLGLAQSINDKSRIDKVKDILFTLDAAIGDVKNRGLWWMLFDNLYNASGVTLTTSEKNSIVGGLEHVLQITTDQEQGHFDPWAAQGAAERLERHYRRIGQMAEVHRVVRAYGKAFENAAKNANALLAVAWLQPVFEKYQDVGMAEDAQRVHRVLETRGQDAQAGMQKIEIPVQINMDEVKRFAEALTDGDWQRALKRIGIMFVPRADQIRSFNEEVTSAAPLMSLIPIRRFEAGHPAGIIGSQDEDPDGRLIHQMASHIGIEIPWLAVTFDRLVARYSLTAEQMVDALTESPVFGNSRRSILVAGFSAWLGEDYVKAIHVLMPQAEHAVRSLAALSGVPTTTRGYTRGTMQTRGLGELLRDKLFKQLIDDNLRLYLLTFLADPRGINLRNRVAHGLLEQEQMDRALADRLIQVLLALGCLVQKTDDNLESP